MIPTALSSASMVPEARMSILPQSQGTQYLLEVRCAKQPATAIAFVCDLSDSCPSMKSHFEALGRLTRDLPRSWPVWFYALSASTEIDLDATCTIEDLQNATISAADILRDRVLMEAGRTRGSLLRPALEAIADRSQQEAINSVLIIVLTDGELLDAMPLVIPGHCRIVGIAPSESEAKRRHWSRVLPGSILTTMEDRKLDEILQATNNPFFGRCELTWTSPQGVPLPIQYFDQSTSMWRKLDKPLIEANLSAGSAYLLLEQVSKTVLPLKMTCVSLRGGKRVRLQFGAQTPNVDAPIIQLLQESFCHANQPVGETLLDISSDHSEFNNLWQHFTEAYNLAKIRQRWVDEFGKGIAFLALLENLVSKKPGQATYQALLCLTSASPDIPSHSHARLVLVGLSKIAKPAIRWKPEQILPFGARPADIEINYDRMEGRWILQQGNKPPYELEPVGSQKIDGDLLQGLDGPWYVVFSGDIVT